MGARLVGRPSKRKGTHMSATLTERVKLHPSFAVLVNTRRRFALQLAACMLVIYFGFILLLAYGKPLLAAPLLGTIVSWGMPIGLGVIVSAFVLTGIYVRRANAEFDALTRQIVEDMQ
jgi:uncharacterized membrane protein (DUF485 family)